MTCLQTAFIAVAGDDAHSRAVDTGADESVHVVVAQVFDLKIIRLRNTKQTAGGNKKKIPLEISLDQTQQQESHPS